ncbi:Tensin-3 [Balamuthia mandrillaris]
MTPLKNKIRATVSQDRIRFADKQHNLDLTYITSNIIAMAYPASGIEATYRNDVDDVAQMLNTYHGKHFMIWNLSGRRYDYSKFNHQVLEYYFPDHHSPPLDLLTKIIVSMDSWLSADPLNVSVIHCVGGKGRTGTVIACYLSFKGLFDSPEGALEFFGQMRSSKEKGVTQVAQKRYVRYFGRVLQERRRLYPQPLYIRRIILPIIPRWKRHGCRPFVEIYDTCQHPRKLLYTSKFSDSTRFYFADSDTCIKWEMECLVKGDVLILFRHLRRVKDGKLEGGGAGGVGADLPSKEMFRYAFHTAFVEDLNGTILHKSDLDLYNKPKKFLESLPDNDMVVNIITEPLEADLQEHFRQKVCQDDAIYQQLFAAYKARSQPKRPGPSSSDPSSSTLLSSSASSLPSASPRIQQTQPLRRKQRLNDFRRMTRELRLEHIGLDEEEENEREKLKLEQQLKIEKYTMLLEGQPQSGLVEVWKEVIESSRKELEAILDAERNETEEKEKRKSNNEIEERRRRQEDDEEEEEEESEVNLKEPIKISSDSGKRDGVLYPRSDASHHPNNHSNYFRIRSSPVATSPFYQRSSWIGVCRQFNALNDNNIENGNESIMYQPDPRKIIPSSPQERKEDPTEEQREEEAKAAEEQNVADDREVKEERELNEGEDKRPNRRVLIGLSKRMEPLINNDNNNSQQHPPDKCYSSDKAVAWQAELKAQSYGRSNSDFSLTRAAEIRHNNNNNNNNRNHDLDIHNYNDEYLNLWRESLARRQEAEDEEKRRRKEETMLKVAEIKQKMAEKMQQLSERKVSFEQQEKEIQELRPTSPSSSSSETMISPSSKRISMGAQRNGVVSRSPDSSLS